MGAVTMAPMRGYKLDDVESTKLFSSVELREVRVLINPVNLLAVWLFLGRHADRRAYVSVRGVTDGIDEKGERGNG